MANTRIIPIPKDAPPGTVPTFRELIDRIYQLESAVASNASEGNAAVKGQAATVQNLAATVYDLNSRYTVQSDGDFFYNSGSIPATSTFATFGKEMSVTFISPGKHKQIIISYGVGEVSLAPNGAGDSVVGDITFKFLSSGTYGSYLARLYSANNVRIGASIFGQKSFRLGAGQYTVTAVTRAWSGVGSSGTASVAFTQPYLNVQIVGSDSENEFS